ncbi:MAG: hypothetical protein AAF035_07250 [Pseudomonadota bacterium]
MADDPFEEFRDWLKERPEGEAWPEPWEAETLLTEDQKRIVAQNAGWLLNREEWTARVEAFEAALATVDDDECRKTVRARYAIRFDRHRFQDGAKNFSRFSFPCSSYFRDAEFGQGNVSFSGAGFGEGDVTFSGAEFRNGNVSFSGAEFGDGGVYFGSAKFGEGDVTFSGAEFRNGNVSFFGAKFGKGVVSFNGAKFGKGDVYFSGAKFGQGNVSFSDAEFGQGNVYFMGAKFHPATTMAASAMVVDGSIFVNCAFGSWVDFTQLKVGEVASFAGSSFARVPDFRYAKLDRPPEVANMEVPAPEMVRDPQAVAHAREGHLQPDFLKSIKPASKCPPFQVGLDKEDVARYRALKAMAEQANDHEKAGEFFAYEMMAKRGVETTTVSGLLFSTLYWRLSLFGQSFLRPLAALAASFISFFFLYAAITVLSLGRYAEPAIDGMAWFAALFSAKSTLPLVGSLFRFTSSPTEYVSSYQRIYDGLGFSTGTVDLLIFFSVIQSIIGGILLFLFLLALRNRFRLR